MTLNRGQISETTLTINLNELAHTLTRELAMACRKVGIYGPAHEMAQKAAEKPLFAFDRAFAFKNHVNFNIADGHLFALNIRLKQSPFTDDILRYMQVLDLRALLFGDGLGMGELVPFLDRFVKKVTPDDDTDIMSTFLRQRKIECIEVNSERAVRMFEDHHQYRDDLEADYSVRSAALAQLGDDLRRLGEIAVDGQAALDKYHIDYTNDVATYLLPEKVASFPCDTLAQEIGRLLQESAEADDPKTARAQIHRAWRLIDLHPDRETVLEILQSLSPEDSLCAALARETGGAVDTIRSETRSHIDDVIVRCMESEASDELYDAFVGAFNRLLGTGQRGKAIEVLCRLTDYLNSPDTPFRARALGLLIRVVDEVNLPSDRVVFTGLLKQVRGVLDTQQESFEYAEFVWRLFDKCLAQRRFDHMAQLAGIVGRRRKASSGITVYDSIGIKKIIENINRSEIVSLMIDEMVRTDAETAGYIREILVCCGAEDTAVGLSQVISHPIRQVRQQALKILAELGKASLKVFTQIIMDDSMFDREVGRQELPDSKWYVIRNSIFVLGLLKDQEGIVPLRLRISDPDIRVRREIVSSLEKIGGEDACDLLIVMADDPHKEIRERAVIAAGVVGTPEMAPLMIDLIERNPAIAGHGIVALGRIGGPTAATYLGALLEDEPKVSELAAVSGSRGELRLAVVKALGEIGDVESIERLEEFKRRQSGARKLFSRQSEIGKAVDEILSRK